MATGKLWRPLEWLDAHVNMETGVGFPLRDRAAAPTRDRIEKLLQYLGSPEVEYPAVHITGTNGKTSTARMVTALLAGLGLEVGSYTSPHLQRVNERMSLNGTPISDEELDEVLRVVALVERELDLHPSYFEVITAAALRWFADLAVQVAVVEVGMGGTWDATNSVDGQVAVVLNVSVDHVQYLGPTRADIATEKAGIIKPGSTLVLGETDPDLAPLFLDRGAAEVMLRDRDFGVRDNVQALSGRLLELYTPGGRYADVFLPLYGEHQADNAAAALAAAEAMVGGPLAEDVVRTGFAQVRSPGRLEIVGRHPLVVLDGAHNVAGAEALRRALASEFAPAPRSLVVGLLREKDPREMLTALGLDEASMLVCCRPPSPRALDPADIARAAIELGFPEHQIEVVEAVSEAVATALLGAVEDAEIVITGSLYVVGAARTALVKDED